MEKEKFSFNDFYKSDLMKQCAESFDKQPENPTPNSPTVTIAPMNDDEVKFAIESIVSNFR